MNMLEEDLWFRSNVQHKLMLQLPCFDLIILFFPRRWTYCICLSLILFFYRMRLSTCLLCLLRVLLPGKFSSSKYAVEGLRAWHVGYVTMRYDVI